MLKASLLLVMRLALLGSVTAQNLVVNPSFENIATCPNDLSQIDLAVGWRGIWSSADLFNACDDDSVAVPYNALGDQQPAEGLGYAGLAIYPTYGKEYIEGELSANLVTGIATYVSMRISPGGFGIPSWTSPIYAASHVGLRLSTVPLSPLTQFGQLEYDDAVLYSTSVLGDTAHWEVLSTVFYPDSEYAYVQIGSFFQDGAIETEVLDANGDFQVAYAFVDLVCVAQQPGVCDEVVGIAYTEPVQLPKRVIVGQVLTLDLSALAGGGPVLDIVLYDNLGRVLRSERPVDGERQLSWSEPDLAGGQYFVELRLQDRPYVVVRWLKI